MRPCLRENVRSASYDLRLGTDYYLGAADGIHGHRNVRISQLSDRDAGIVVPANGVVIVSVLETLHFEDDIIGHLSLKVELLLQGLIMANQSQIDAGYQGSIFALLYNLSSQEITLKHKQPILRLEMVQLEHPTDRPYDGQYQNRSLAQSLPGPIDSSLFKMQRTVDSGARELRRTQISAALLALLLIIAPTVYAFFGPVSDLQERVSRLEGSNPSPAVKAQIARQGAALASLKTEVKRLQSLVRQLRRP